MKRSPISLPLLLFLLTLTGCSEATTDAMQAPPVADVATQSTVAAKPTTKPDQADQKAEAPQSKKKEPATAEVQTDDESSSAKKQAIYEPPFPERIDMFAAPRRNRALKKNDNEQGEAVELMGFSTLDKPRALLLLNGEVSTLAEGDKVGELEVVSIQPPTKVVLQQGRQRTQLSLDN